MLERYFAEVYTKFKLNFYQSVFASFENREASLSVVEAFCAEVIHALNRPTVREFAKFAQISSPNAAYKINNLIKKGYIKKVQNSEDKREFYLEVTEKYLSYSHITYDYISAVMDRIRCKFSADEVSQLEKLLLSISAEIMPEVNLSPRLMPQEETQ